jgi:predicted PurR-regulated permease PerM
LIQVKEVLTRWYQRYFSEEEAVILLVLLAAALAVLLIFGDILAPVFVAVVLAYLMQGVANFLRHRGLPAEVSVGVSTLLFLSGFVFTRFGALGVATINGSGARGTGYDRGGKTGVGDPARGVSRLVHSATGE